MGTLTYVLARRFSTHEVRFDHNQPETTYQYEAPPSWSPTDAAGGPESQLVQPPPVTLTQAEYEKRARLARLEEEFEEQAADIDF